MADTHVENTENTNGDCENTDVNMDNNGAEMEETNTEAEVEMEEQSTENGAGADAAENEESNEKSEDKSEDDDSRKIFIGGLSWETTAQDMKDYFGKFGEVTNATLKTDPNTGRSRGFGFVTFGSVADVDKVVANKSHSLKGRKLDPQRAKARPGKEPIKKIFVGGLDPGTPEEDIKTYFGKFGKVVEIDLPFDKMKNQRRAYCFVQFETEQIADECCKQAKQTIKGKEVDVRKATPKAQDGGGFGERGGRGGFRGGRGGRGGYGGYGGGGGGGWGNQGWGNQGYDSYGYDGGYGGYGGDYSGYDQGWGSYNSGYGNQGGYGGGGYGAGGGGAGYGNGGGGFKAKRGRGATGGGYHPYNKR